MLLVDCYNVLHVVMPSSLAGLDEAGLCRLLGTHPWAKQFGRIIVVADGRPKPRRASVSPVEGVSLRFSGRDQSADDVIIDLIEADSAPRSMTVVSNDREIQRAARSRRASVLRSETLVRELARRSARRGAGDEARPHVSEPLPKSQVEEWLSAFEADPHALGAAESPAEAVRRTKAEAARRAAEEAARPKKSAYRRLRAQPIVAEQSRAPEAPSAVSKPDSKPDSKPAKKGGRGSAGEHLRENGLAADDAERWLAEFGVDAEMNAAFERDAMPEASALPSPPAKGVKRNPQAKPGPLRAPVPVPLRRATENVGDSLDRLSDGDIEAWLRVFGLSQDDVTKK